MCCCFCNVIITNKRKLGKYILMADVEINLESTDPRELLTAGIRSYAIGDFANAVAALGRTTQIFAQKHGDEHDKLGDIYIHYAKALLELSREEAAPFGEGIVPEESSSDSEEGENGVATIEETEEAEGATNAKETKFEKPDKISVESEKKSKIEGLGDKDAKKLDDIDAKVKESDDKDSKAKEVSDEVDKTKEVCQKDTKSEAPSDKKTFPEKREKVEGSDDKDTKTQESDERAVKPDESGDKTKIDGSGDKESKNSQNGTVSSSKPGDSGDQMDEDLTKTTEAGESSGTQEEKVEEPTDLQLAWEVLEVAKKIFLKRGDAGKDMVAETMILLGEVAMESGNFEDGTADMKAGLEMLKSMCAPEDRKLAETYYKLGNALSTIPNIEEAVKNFELSITTIQARLDLLNQRLVGDKKNTEDDRKIVKEEIEELKVLIPEIEEKISDTKSIKDEVAAKLFMELANAAPKPIPEEKKKEVATSSKSINNITHLVKRKRKAEEELAESAGVLPAKKPTP